MEISGLIITQESVHSNPNLLATNFIAYALHIHKQERDREVGTAEFKMKSIMTRLYTVPIPTPIHTKLNKTEMRNPLHSIMIFNSRRPDRY